ncbi:hypothetical protein [Weissella cibaria]|uniref:hypothetical protein n=1 Tax=Weissella cibaria TaxID=137591 RepID=UPI00211F4689|nr:hypothetical protein [Weissella cibaria]
MMERITAAQLLDELHIDPSDEETETVDRLIDDASAIIRGSISDEVEEDELLSCQVTCLTVSSRLWQRNCITTVN